MHQGRLPLSLAEPDGRRRHAHGGHERVGVVAHPDRDARGPERALLAVDRVASLPDQLQLDQQFLGFGDRGVGEALEGMVRQPSAERDLREFGEEDLADSRRMRLHATTDGRFQAQQMLPVDAADIEHIAVVQHRQMHGFRGLVAQAHHEGTGASFKRYRGSVGEAGLPDPDPKRELLRDRIEVQPTRTGHRAKKAVQTGFRVSQPLLNVRERQRRRVPGEQFKKLERTRCRLHHDVIA